MPLVWNRIVAWKEARSPASEEDSVDVRPLGALSYIIDFVDECIDIRGNRIFPDPRMC
ncbi:MAG: hypothetical protein U0V02_05395 [Anaerolineales bacterium]